MSFYIRQFLCQNGCGVFGAGFFPDGECGLRKIKKPPWKRFFIMGIKKLFLPVFHVGFIPVHEFIDAACRIDQFHLACIKRM